MTEDERIQMQGIETTIDHITEQLHKVAMQRAMILRRCTNRAHVARQEEKAHGDEAF